MCECRDCDNFKAKKREPQVGGRVQSDARAGTVVDNKTSYSFSTGMSFKGGDDVCTVFWDVDDGEGRLRNIYTKYLTVLA